MGAAHARERGQTFYDCLLKLFSSSKASPIFKELEEKFSTFRQAISTHNAVQSFTCSAGILEMKPAIMGFVGTVANITSILTKTRDGLLIDMRRANALSDRNEFSKIEACNSTVMRFYNANLSVSDCEKLLRTNPPTLQYTTIKHLLEILHLVEQIGAIKVCSFYFKRKVSGTVAARGAAEELACYLPYMIMQQGDTFVVVDSSHYGAMSSVIADFFTFDQQLVDNTRTKKDSTVSDDNTLKEEVAAVISSVIHNVEKAFIPCLDRLDEHLDQILEGTELELNPSATPKKPGPVPLFQRFPEIITEANTFLTDNGLAAHSRRRSDTSYSMGTTLQQLKLHLLKTVPGLNTVGISNSAVHLLFRPANKMHTWGRRHHAVLNAKVARKRNDACKDRPNAYHCASTVKAAKQFCEKYPQLCTFVSVDDKAKGNMNGKPFVSRYHQNRAFYMEGEGPNFSDHDFPMASYLAVLSGYLIVNIVTGLAQLNIVLRAFKFQNSTAETHCNDLLEILSGRTHPVFFLLSDNRPDWGRLWRELYAPTQSAYNIIEHAWSHVSRLFAGLYLPPHLEGEQLAPCMQSSLSDEEKTAKEAALFDFNLEWEGLQRSANQSYCSKMPRTNGQISGFCNGA